MRLYDSPKRVSCDIQSWIRDLCQYVSNEVHVMYLPRNTRFDRDLRNLYERLPKTEDGFKLMTKTIQEVYLGNYVVQECYRPDSMCWGPEIIFETEHDQTMFLLRYSG